MIRRTFDAVTYPFRIWGAVLLLAAVVGIGLGIYHAAGDIFRARENAKALRAAGARADTLTAKLDTAIARGDSLTEVARSLTERADSLTEASARARQVADSAKAKAQRLAAELRADTSTRNPEGYVRFTLADSLDFWAPPQLLTILETRDSAFATLDHALTVTTVALGEQRARADRWQAAAENYRAALDTAELAIAAKDSVIALHEEARPSWIRRVWEKLDAPLAFMAGIYVATR
jgi:hypothetical protein